MSDKNQISEMVESLIKNIKNVLDIDTVVGSTIEISSDIKLVPITKISVGFVSGGGEYGCDKKIVKNLKQMPFAGGGGGGLSVSPIGFLEIKKNTCKLIRVEEKSVYQNILDKLPGVLNGVAEIIDKGDKNAKKIK